MDRELDVAELITVLGAYIRMSIRLPEVQRLSFTTLSVLHTLTHEGPKRMSELTASEQVTQPAVTQIVTKLERDGLVERRPDPSDGRGVVVHITPPGAEITKARRADRLARLTELVSHLTAEERRAIAAALPAPGRLVEVHHRLGANQRSR